MKLKEGTMIYKKEQYILELNNEKCRVNREDAYLIDALHSGVEKSEELKKLIMKEKKVNEAAAGFTIARFILDYQNYLEEDKSFFEITE